MTSVNQYKNVLGIYPKGWRVPLDLPPRNHRRPNRAGAPAGRRAEVIPEKGTAIDGRPARRR